MWTCPKCERQFKTTNQSHACGVATLDDLFEGKPDHLLLAFDRILAEVIDWQPCSVGAAKKAVVFTSKKAWLIVRPMKKELDLKFYYEEELRSGLLKKVAPWTRNKFAHHIRVQGPEDITPQLLDLLRIGHTYSLE